MVGLIGRWKASKKYYNLVDSNLKKLPENNAMKLVTWCKLSTENLTKSPTHQKSLWAHQQFLSCIYIYIHNLIHVQRLIGERSWLPHAIADARF